MLKSVNGTVEYEGEASDVLSDLGIAAAALAGFYGRDTTLEVCLFGLFGEDESDFDKIHEAMKKFKFDV